MEFLKLSKFKLQLRALVTEVRDLRERERSVNEQIYLLIQKQKQTEEEYGRKLQELQAELASSNELRQKLERKVNYLQNDNALLEYKQKELKATIHDLLQSRENFVNAYEESTCEMKRSIETRDRQLSALSEKINSHLSLFDSIEKEAISIKQVVDNVRCVVREKEEVVAGLKSKMDMVSAFEKVFIEKIHELEHKLKNEKEEFQRKDKIILELEAQLEAAKISNCQIQIEELQKTISVKDAVIQNLISEKEALHFEMGSLGIVLQKIQNTVGNMIEEDKRVFSSILECQGDDCDTVTANENDRIEDVVHNSRDSNKTSRVGAADTTASPVCQEYNSVGNPLWVNNNMDSCMSEFACSPPQSVFSEPQFAANVLSTPVNDAKDDYTVLANHLSECSTTQAETSKDPEAEV